MIQIALIGYGFLGKWHAEKINSNPLCKFFAIVDRNKEHLETAKKKFPNVKCVTNLNQVLDDIDGAIIAAPTSTHYELCDLLLENNKHIFCEKPLCENFAEAKQLEKKIIDLKFNKLFQVGHSERFHPIWEEKKELLLSSFCENATVHFNRLAPFKNRATDVDVIADLMIHDIDLMFFLFEEIPTNVTSTCGKFNTDNIDFATAIFEFTKNRVVIMNASRIEQNEKRNLIIRSKQGFLEIDLLNKKFIHTHETKDYIGADHLMIENNFFINSILNKEKAIINFNDGLKAVQYIDLVRQQDQK